MQELTGLTNLRRKVQPETTSILRCPRVKSVQHNFFTVRGFVRELLNRPLSQFVLVLVPDDFKAFKTGFLWNRFGNFVEQLVQSLPRAAG